MAVLPLWSRTFRVQQCRTMQTVELVHLPIRPAVQHQGGEGLQQNMLPNTIFLRAIFLASFTRSCPDSRLRKLGLVMEITRQLPCAAGDLVAAGDGGQVEGGVAAVSLAVDVGPAARRQLRHQTRIVVLGSGDVSLAGRADWAGHTLAAQWSAV